MILFRNDKAQDWFHTLPPQLIRSFNELSLVFTKEYSSNRSMKKTSNHLFNIVKDHKETICDYVKRFKTEKAKIISYNEDITTATFRNGLSIEHLLFKKLIMGEELTLAVSYALAEKHTLCDEAKQSNKNESEKKRMERSLTREDLVPETFTKFTVPISQILCKLKNKPWFELPPPMKADLTKLNYTKYCAFHQGLGHTTNSCLKWKQYLEKLTNKGWCDEYLDRRCASGDTRPGLSTGSGGQINESPEKYAVTDEEQNGFSSSNDKILPTPPVQVVNQDYNMNNNSSTACDDQPATNDEY
ncbi:uncharacterized protein LOC103934893 [Pyrus x bretschneideri]|uniref:uncharacterized protein LOC103934893 n=1 Tax=Pyrus x bretschneideri TaxID=225117 RepID=UPI00202FBAED|nr:uncharacterized protein LOC103934893 [Pyrus x bretschneideri]